MTTWNFQVSQNKHIASLERTDSWIYALTIIGRLTLPWHLNCDNHKLDTFSKILFYVALSWLSVQLLTLAQVMIPWFVGMSPVLSVQILLGILCLSLSLCPSLVHVLCLSLSQNKKTFKKKSVLLWNFIVTLRPSNQL